MSARKARLTITVDPLSVHMPSNSLMPARPRRSPRSEEADDLLGGLELLGNVTVAPLKGAEQAARLAEVVSRTGLDPWDAYVAAIADVSICPILTVNAAKWREPAGDLDEPLHIIEIADPDEWNPED